ncbi:hybrid sensor histidine kinase/response regulator [Mariniblastus fucicola]|uniref:histidine kinase n=1 Tax=Mariniblastus fucicola TaxID=980251 RepID=A0A5B9P850_9BACT|nr:ATP-binding protein [Mariniblastus fucicola]QEG20796.1 Sensor protein ZraS [Mariniblastus fucicola]
MNTKPGIDIRQILVVDDNEAIHRDFDKILSVEESSNSSLALDELDAMLFGDEESARPRRHAEFELSHATQGQQALGVLQEQMESGIRFGAAFVDMRMPPGWNGVETIEQLWKVDPDLQVVICSAFSDHSWEEIIERLGCTDQLLVLKKPFEEIEVVQIATSLCEKRRLLELSRATMTELEIKVGEQAAELEAAQEDAETLIQSISSLLIGLNGKGCVTRWNHVATEVLGIEESDAMGTRFVDLDIEWSKPEKVRGVVCSKSSQCRRREEVQFTDADGQTKTIDMHVCSIVNDPTSQSRLIIANDITRQKFLKSQLDQSQRLESVGQLAAGVAHEINTPMQYIGDNVRYVAKSIERMQTLLDVLPDFVDDTVSDEQMLLLRQTLREQTESRKVKSSLQQIPEALSDSIEGVESVARIVAAMKELSHPGGNEMSHVSLTHILESTITVARNEWKYVADVETDFCDSLPEIPAFASELNQAFMNMIINSAHAIGEQIEEGRTSKGKIRIVTRVEGKFAFVSIEDTGGGIPEKVRERIFEPFFTTKDVGKGTGQGLAIAHSVIVSKHSGSLSFDVEDGVGTTFNVRLPLELPAKSKKPESDMKSSVEEVI